MPDGSAVFAKPLSNAPPHPAPSEARRFAPSLRVLELRGSRRAALFDILIELNSQAFMTGTDRGLFSSLDGRARFLRVAGGTIARD